MASKALEELAAIIILEQAKQLAITKLKWRAIYSEPYGVYDCIHIYNDRNDLRYDWIFKSYHKNKKEAAKEILKKINWAISTGRFIDESSNKY